MTSKLTHIGIIGLAAFFAVAGTPASAAGTASGTAIENIATVNYQVGGVSQTQKTASDSFVVDRKVDLLVEKANSATVEVVPGQNDAYATFQLRNDSNETLDFALAVTHLSGGTSVHGGTDTFDALNVRIYRDNPTTGSIGTWDSGDVLVTHVDELAADQTARLFVLVDIEDTLANGAVSGIQLRATAHAGATPGTLGALVTQTAGANTAGKDTVFADAGGVNDTARDGAHSAANDFTVRTATLTVTKRSRVVWDPFNEETDPKMIPGSRVEYCISVSNTGSVAATNVTITDSVPSQLSFIAGSIRLNGTVTGDTCNADGAAGGSYAAPVVSGTVSTPSGGGALNAGDTRTLVFRATVN